MMTHSTKGACVDISSFPAAESDQEARRRGLEATDESPTHSYDHAYLLTATQAARERSVLLWPWIAFLIHAAVPVADSESRQGTLDQHGKHWGYAIKVTDQRSRPCLFDTSTKASMRPETSSPTRDRDMTDSAASTILSIVIIRNDGDMPQHQTLIETGREPTFGSINLTLHLACSDNRTLGRPVDIGSTISVAVTLRADSGQLWVLRDAVVVYLICRILPSFACVIALSLALSLAARRCEYSPVGTGDGEVSLNRADEGIRTPPSTPIEPAAFNHSWDNTFGRFGGGSDGLTESEDVSDTDSRHGDEWEDIDL
jgi:hypothetical protein